MAEKELTDAQVSLVIDFLKRWGIDSPELVFELTDHYCEKAKDGMASGLTFDEVLDSWKTKKHFRDLRKIESEFEGIMKRKWWRAHLLALKRLFFSKQLFLFVGVMAIMLLTYYFGLGSIFSAAALLGATLVWCGCIYIYYFKRFSWFFETRDITVPFMGAYLIVWECISEGGYRTLFAGEPFQLSMIALTVSIISGFIGYNLLSGAHRELKLITDEYIREPRKFQQR